MWRAFQRFGFKRTFNTLCYSSIVGATCFVSYKYTDRNVSYSSKLQMPSISCQAIIDRAMFKAQCASSSSDDYLNSLADENIDEHFHLRSSIANAKKMVSANKMLDVFKAMYRSGGDISKDFLVEMFYTAGIEDERVAIHLFDLMDRNHDGFLQPSEIMAVLTLFHAGSPTQRFKFLFRCLDLDGGGTVDKAEFRECLTAILEAQYHMAGLNDLFDHDEIFANVFPHEYRTVAKFKANRIVRDIFLVADINRDGELSLKEFLHWCRTNSKEVRLLENALLTAVDTVG